MALPAPAVPLPPKRAVERVPALVAQTANVVLIANVALKACEPTFSVDPFSVLAQCTQEEIASRIHTSLQLAHFRPIFAYRKRVSPKIEFLKTFCQLAKNFSSSFLQRAWDFDFANSGSVSSLSGVFDKRVLAFSVDLNLFYILIALQRSTSVTCLITAGCIMTSVIFWWSNFAQDHILNSSKY